MTSSSPPPADALFTLNAGRYAVEARLGAGAGGEVYAGRDLMLERPVAIKRLPAQTAAIGSPAPGAMEAPGLGAWHDSP